MKFPKDKQRRKEGREGQEGPEFSVFDGLNVCDDLPVFMIPTKVGKYFYAQDSYCRPLNICQMKCALGASSGAINHPSKSVLVALVHSNPSYLQESKLETAHTDARSPRIAGRDKRIRSIERRL